jgi:hypothetical protein
MVKKRDGTIYPKVKGDPMILIYQTEVTCRKKSHQYRYVIYGIAPGLLIRSDDQTCCEYPCRKLLSETGFLLGLQDIRAGLYAGLPFQ